MSLIIATAALVYRFLLDLTKFLVVLFVSNAQFSFVPLFLTFLKDIRPFCETTGTPCFGLPLPWFQSRGISLCWRASSPECNDPQNHL